MSFPLFANIVTTILCLAVLVQSVRMMRSLKAVGNDQLTSVVTALDESTTQARMVLSNLKHTLEGDFAGSVKLVLEGREIRDELKMLIEIANSMAERLCESGRPIAEPEPQPQPQPQPQPTFEAPAPRPVERAPEPLVINLAPEPAEPVASEPPVRAPSAAAKPMNKDDIAASLAELRAVLSRPARPSVSAEAQAEAA
jgi:hypothetical protein